MQPDASSRTRPGASKRGSGSVGGMLLGGHCSGGIKKALENANAFGMDSVQLFAQSPRTWRFPEHDPADLEAFRARREELGIGAVSIHALYLLNLASPKDDFYEKSVATLCSTVDTAAAIGAESVVFHVGSHLGSGFEAGLERVVPALAEALERTQRDDVALHGERGGNRRHGRPLAGRAGRDLRRGSAATSGSASASTRVTCLRPATTSPSRPCSTSWSGSSTARSASIACAACM